MYPVLLHDYAKYLLGSTIYPVNGINSSCIKLFEESLSKVSNGELSVETSLNSFILTFKDESRLNSADCSKDKLSNESYLTDENLFTKFYDFISNKNNDKSYDFVHIFLNFILSCLRNSSNVSRLSIRYELLSKLKILYSVYTYEAMNDFSWRQRQYDRRFISRQVINFSPTRIHDGVYILTYHSIVDSHHMLDWERSYTKAIVDVELFQAQIKRLSEFGFKPVTLGRALEILCSGEIDDRYIVITFDDGYENIIRNAEPVLRKYGFPATVFVNGKFAENSVYYRVLSAFLLDNGKMQYVYEQLQEKFPNISWSQDKQIFYSQLKNEYNSDTFFAIESAIISVYEHYYGCVSSFRCHLLRNELEKLDKDIWSIGNHTWSHRNLTSNYEAIKQDIETNFQYFNNNNIESVKCLAYPNGHAKHLASGVQTWLNENPDWVGLFANGGVNFLPSRSSIFRIPVSNISADALTYEMIRQSNISIALHNWIISRS